MTRGPGTVARIKTECGQTFAVEQVTRTRNAHGARKSVATLYVLEPGRSKVQQLDSSLRDTGVALDHAEDVVNELTTGVEEIIEQ